MKTIRFPRASRATTAQGATVLALVAAMALTGFTASSSAADTAAARTAVSESSRNALAAVTPGPPQLIPSRPTPGLIEASKPLGAPAPLAEPSNEYSFLQTNPDGSPVTYDPCRPIHYVTRTATQPAGGKQVVKDAIAAVSKATGLVFIDDGETTEAAGFTRKPFQPEHYGDRWAPVLIAWAGPDEDQNFATGSVLGLGQSVPAWFDPSAASYVTGEVDLNVDLLSRYGDGFKQVVLEHELGHVVGLDHHDGQLMSAVADHEVYGYQAGDLAGLAVLGQGKCLGI
ncbi:hypothetical protein [Pseudarthrobacter phenanthrenivorans]|uniref:hypothetical protein n=1 Tax=Pseudarthrobacter phenanthrenivorans TaxID=361575 RepID=UPI000691641B|nr:hypothetical protein [Pseudarthrobacter phenanthrenivorans]